MDLGPRLRLLALAILAASLLAPPREASASWPPFGRAITTALENQQHAVATSDGAGGAIIAWQDLRDPKVNIVARHVLASGELDAAWPENGRVLLGDAPAMASADAGQKGAVIVSDGAGGAIVAWQDLRDSTTSVDLFAQHVLASGALDPAWAANGTAICRIEGIQNSQAIVSDGAGGAFVTWLDSRPGASASDIYAQHLLASGAVDPRWPVNGLAVSAAAGVQEAPAIAEDASGGAIVSWQDTRSDPSNLDIYAQHVLASGALDGAWPADGVAVSVTTGSQAFPTMAGDGAHGAVIAWTDARSATEQHIFAQHVLATGAVDPVWPANGKAISDAADVESHALLVPDGIGGAIVTWQGFTVALNRTSVYAQHVLAAGIVDPAWPPAGRALGLSEEQQTRGQIASDGAGGAIVAWTEKFDIFAQHVLASGLLDPSYPSTGQAVCNLPSGQTDPALVATGGGGAIVAWTDTRSGVGLDIYAAQVAVPTTTGVGDPSPAGFAIGRSGPNPARGSFVLRFSVPREARATLAVYDVSGRRVRMLTSGAQPGGEQAIAWDLLDDRGRAVGTGVYFARLEAGGRTVTTKISALR